MNIEKLKENIENIDADNISNEDISSIRQTIDALDNGKIRVAEQVLSLIHISEPTRPERISYSGLWV